jgi:photosystem II stability/assembly factor-like uncharacterized protein
MKKIFVLAFAAALTAVSCNQIINGGTGSMGVFRSDDFGDHFRAVNTITKKTNLNSTSVNCLAFDPTDSNIIYLCSSAGVYKTVDGGGSWKLLVTNILVADIAIDPTNPQTIYAAGVSDNHAKIIKTADAGVSWTELYTEPTTSNIARGIVVDPKDRLHLIAGLDTGEIIHSTDGGVTWQIATDIHDYITKIKFGPNGNLYAMALDNGLYESKDSGQTFSLISSALTSSIGDFQTTLATATRFLDLAFDAQQRGVLYVAAPEGLVRTVNDGANWSYMKMPVRNGELRTSAVAVNPRDSNNIYAVIGSTLFKTTNGGVTWETKPLPSGQEVRIILIDPSSPNTLYLGLGVSK